MENDDDDIFLDEEEMLDDDVEEFIYEGPYAGERCFDY